MITDFLVQPAGRRSLFTVPIAAALANVTLPASGAPRTRSDDWIPPTELLSNLPTMMRAACMPGISIACLNPDQPAWTWTHGVADIGSGAPVRTRTLFEAASMTKPLFAYAILKLVEIGDIELDRPLVDYHRPAYLPSHRWIERITARHVLTHSSGLPNWGEEDDLSSVVPAFEPGSHFSYSGEGFFWLQLVAEAVTGRSAEMFVRATLFDPAGMHESSLLLDSGRNALMASGHVRGERGPSWRREKVFELEAVASRWKKPMREWLQRDWVTALAEISPGGAPHKRVKAVNAASSLLTTPTDYLRFMTLLTDLKARQSWQILDSSRRAMIAPQMAVRPNLPFWWGLSWNVERVNGNWWFSHQGNNDRQFTCFAVGDARSGRAITILTNGGSGFPIYERVVRATTGQDMLSFVGELYPPRRG